jgi:thiamine-monophosphate kinase
LYEDKIPITEDSYNMALKFNLDPTTCALSGGEDYELLFTVAQKDFEKIQGNPFLSVIGHIANASEGAKLITKGNNVHDLKAQGWNQFPEKSN